jgi:hypothetical protein
VGKARPRESSITRAQAAILAVAVAVVLLLVVVEPFVRVSAGDTGRLRDAYTGVVMSCVGRASLSELRGDVETLVHYGQGHLEDNVALFGGLRPVTMYVVLFDARSYLGPEGRPGSRCHRFGGLSRELTTALSPQ